jgi:hypothetical protein
MPGFPGMALKQLQTLVDGLMEGPNLFYAVRVDGRFASVTTRSVPRQQRPYPPLAEVAKTQPVFHLDNVSGTLAGFRFPDFARGLNVPGLHLHFLTEDHRAGGHVLDLVLECGEVASTPRPASTWSCRPSRSSCMPTWATSVATSWTGPSGGSDPLPTFEDVRPLGFFVPVHLTHRTGREPHVDASELPGDGHFADCGLPCPAPGLQPGQLLPSRYGRNDSSLSGSRCICPPPTWPNHCHHQAVPVCRDCRDTESDERELG